MGAPCRNTVAMLAISFTASTYGLEGASRAASIALSRPPLLPFSSTRSSLPAQAPAWTATTDAGAVLWYHCLALLDVRGPGELPLHEPGYAGRVAREKAARDVRTRLDAEAERLGAALRADPAFEVLHFVPLYFAASERSAMLDALRRVAEGAPPGALTERERFGAAAVSGVLRTPEQRRLLGRLVAVMEEEWRVWLGPERARAPMAVPAAFDATWRRLEPQLRPYLRARRLDGGRILLVPALGADGRFFEGLPAVRDDNVVAVGTAAGGADAAWRVVRELCYPAVRQALRARVTGDRETGERESGRAAVRCGALLLERLAPEEVPAYETAWLRAAGRSGSFAEAFAVSEEVLAALRRELAGP